MPGWWHFADHRWIAVRLAPSRSAIATWSFGRVASERAEPGHGAGGVEGVSSRRGCQDGGLGGLPSPRRTLRDPRLLRSPSCDSIRSAIWARSASERWQAQAPACVRPIQSRHVVGSAKRRRCRWHSAAICPPHNGALWARAFWIKKTENWWPWTSHNIPRELFRTSSRSLIVAEAKMPSSVYDVSDASNGFAQDEGNVTSPETASGQARGGGVAIYDAPWRRGAAMAQDAGLRSYCSPRLCSSVTWPLLASIMQWNLLHLAWQILTCQGLWTFNLLTHS